jgi:hypothetical protein
MILNFSLEGVRFEGSGGAAAGNIVEVLLHEFFRIFGPEVARNDENGVGGVVVRGEEIPDPLQLRAFQVAQVADDGMLVRPPSLVGQPVDLEEARNVGLVVVVFQLFLDDHRALVLEVLLRDLERAHPVGLQP